MAKSSAAQIAPKPRTDFKLSIVIPCYNEQKRINMLFGALASFTQAWKYDYEIIIVDDGSTDGVVAAIEANEFVQAQQQKGKFLLHKVAVNQGKGNALQEGVALATGTHILTMDADLSYDPALVIEWLKIKKEFADDEILLGSRLHRESENTWEDPQAAGNNKGLRKMAGYVFSAMTKVLTSIKVRDNQSGFKLYPAALGKYLFRQMKIKGWAHDVELLYRADLNRFKITEMPVKCVNRGGSKINVVSDSIKMLWQTFLLGIRMRWNYYLAQPFKILTGKYSEDTIPPVKDTQKYKLEAKFRFLFSLTVILMFIIMPFISKDFGISGDEIIQNTYGHEVYNYFAHGDSTAYSEIGRPQNYDAIIYYSGGYELLLVTIAKWFPGVFEFDVRHFINAFVGCLLFLFTGLLAKRLAGWRAGFIALLFIWLSPRLFGESINNSKDIPFALGMTFTIYHMIPFLKALPRPSWRSATLIALGIAFTLNIRIGGLLLYAYLALFTAVVYLYKVRKKEIASLVAPGFGRLVVMLGAVVVASYFLGIVTWPYALQSPLSNPLLSMEKMTNFPITIRVLFDNEVINSGMPPWNYTLIWIFRTSPEIVLICFVLFVVLIFNIANYFSKFSYLLLFVTIFPVVYAVYKHSALYDGWRHFLFVYPTLAIGAAMAFIYILEKSKAKGLRIALSLVVVVGLILPVKSLFALHPYEYTYFNDASGGLKAAYKRFETDYYMNSAKECFYTLAKKEDLAHTKDTIVILTNMAKEITEYAKTVSPKIKVYYSKFENRTESDYNYGIFFSRFVDYDLLKAGGWPPANTYVMVEREGVPLSIAIKKTNKGDIRGTEAMKAGKLQEAIPLFESYLKEDPTNEAVLAKLGQCYMNTGNFPKAIEAFEKAIKRDPADNNMIMLGICYAQSGNTAKAITLLQNGANKIKEEYEHYRDMYMDDETNLQAGAYMQQTGQVLGSYYYYIAVCYQQSGDMQQAGTYLNMAKGLNPQIK